MKKFYGLLICLLTTLLLFCACTPQGGLNGGSFSSDFVNNGSSEIIDESVSVEFITQDDLTVELGSTYQLEWEVTGNYTGEITWRANNAYASVSILGEVTGVIAGQTRVTIMAGEASDSITVTVVGTTLENPYENVRVTEFYQNYTPATSYLDSQFRSELNLMSGSIESQNQVPEINDYRPIERDLYLKNSRGLYSSDKKIYYLLNERGEIVLEIYKGGAYVILEEVAAYIFAFNDVPVNYDSNKNASPRNSEWGKYLRVNHTKFSGNTNKYPYEPVLPNISGCGGDYDYYEVDIGTTGTTAGNYPVKVYNDGSTITRGAARIVYSRFNNGSAITDLSKKYLFYTYNHYNDFQEYLNYYGGWGEMFGNITGGGELSSKYDYNPTPYVPVQLYDFALFSDYSYASEFSEYLPN